MATVRAGPAPNAAAERHQSLSHSIRQEWRNFWLGVVESFGVEWVHADAPAKKSAHALASPAAKSPSFSPPGNSGAAQVDDNPLQVDATACPSPATPSGISTTAGDRGVLLSLVAPTQSTPAVTVTAKTWCFVLMPPWSLVEFDPKLWMLLRKNMLANLALTALTVAYIGLSQRLTATKSASPSSTTSLEAAAVRPSSSSSSLSSLLVFWWLRLCLWGLKYVGQWPFYTVLQIVGLVWYSQLYRETWLVRKRWVLRGTRLREVSALSSPSPSPSAARTAAQNSASSAPPPPLPQLSAGVTRPWLAPLPLNPPSHLYDRVSGSGSLLPAQQREQALRLLQASVVYVRHVAQLVLRMFTHKGPTAPLQEWVLGDTAAATAAAARQAAAATASPSSPDVFESVVRHLEATSEVIFKALATMSFAFFASCMERLPVVGTPVCLLLNAQLYAFYVFDYRYATQQQPDTAHQRGSALLYQLYHFEQCWAYYAGYGIGSAVLSLWLTHHVGVVVSVCAMSVLYSWQVVWSGFAVPLPSSRPVPLFSLWFYAVDTVQKQYAVLWRCVCILGLLYIPYQCLYYL